MFEEWGLKKLICTSYAPHSNQDGLFQVDIPEEMQAPHYDPELSETRGRVRVLEREDLNGDGKFDRADMKWGYLEGDGDFRSAEVTALRDEADIVVTNPPFSLFREFLAWLMAGGVKFSVIGNLNAVTYKEMFPLIRDNQVRMGATANSTNMIFRVPDGAEVKPADRAKTIRMLRAMGGAYAELPYDATYTRQMVRWFTNIEHGRRHQPMELMTMDDNIKFSKHAEVRGVGYSRYDNFDAIDVGFTDAIPSDHAGVMGVPITFLDKYDPEQFEILGTTQSWDTSGLKIKTYPTQTQVTKAGHRSQVGTLNAGGAIRVQSVPDSTYYVVDSQMYVQPYKRIFIRHRNPDPQKD